MSSSTKGHRFLSRATQAAAGALALAALFTLATPERARAVECLLDTNNNGVANGGDTDGGALGTGADSLACGVNTRATAEGSVAVGGDPDNNGTGTEASGFAATAVGGDAFAPGFGSTAVGGDTDFATNPDLAGATASGTLSSAFGADSLASGPNSTALGAFSDATANNSTATGAFAEATADASTATGVNADATGPGSTATGFDATASGQLSTALGANTEATALLSTALGAGAIAELPAEFVMGTRENTYTAPGITSRLSESRQFGRLELLTTDRFGHLASDGGIVFDKLAEVQAGVALGLAMEAPDLAPAERFALRVGYGNFEGDSHAFGITAIGSLLEDSRRWTWDAGFGAGWSEFGGFESGASWGGRAGIQMAW